MLPFLGGFPVLIYAVLTLCSVETQPNSSCLQTHTVIIGGPIKVATMWQTLPGWGSLPPEALGLGVSRFTAEGDTVTTWNVLSIHRFRNST